MMCFLVIYFFILVAVTSSISDASIKVYWGNFLCGKNPSGSLKEPLIHISPIHTGDCLICNGKDINNCKNSTDYYPIQYCVEVGNTDKCGSDAEHLVEDLLVYLDTISKFFHSYPSGCSENLQKGLATSGYYTIRAPNGSLISVYCDMKGSNCDGKGGWMRVGYLNMSEPNATCPSGLTLREFNNIDYGLCGRPKSSSVIYSAHGIHYSKVCGQIRGYQFGSPDGLPPLYGPNVTSNIDNCNTYVDGVTITYGSNPRKHIWTYACGVREYTNDQYSCPCNNGSSGTTSPNFVGKEYYCESGLHYGNVHPVLYSNDTLWDDQQCGGLEGPCCTNPKMPWFVKTLDKTTLKDIELRMCGSEGAGNEDTPLYIIELYIY